MNSIQELMFSLRAGYSFFYLQTEEADRTVNTVKEAISELNGSSTFNYEIEYWDYETNPDPEDAVATLDNPERDPGLVMVAKNWNWFLMDDYGRPEKRLVSFLMNRFAIWTTSEYRRIFMIVSSDPFEEGLPVSLQKEFLKIEFALPDESEIAKSLEFIIESAKDSPKFKVPSLTDKERIVQSARGLTSREVVNTFSYSIISTGGEIDHLVVAERRAKEVEKTAGLKIGKYSEKMENIKGNDVAKDFVLDTIDSPLSKGNILLGPPGTGKTTFARACGAAAGRIVFEMELAELFGGLVGDTERLVRQAISVVKANSPCILFIDEVEKGLSGASGSTSSSTDGGTTKRAMSQLLKFLSEDHEGIYVLATCNDITSLDPEWVRPGRWDSSPWFLDLPTEEQKKEIWEHHVQVYEVSDADYTVVNTDGWSGAEIEACCKLASPQMKDVPLIEASNFIKPVSLTMQDKIDALRSWKENRTNDSNVLPSSVKSRTSMKGVDVKGKKRQLNI